MGVGTPEPIPVEPPVYRQALLALLVGLTIGPIVGWLAGTFATFLAVAVSDAYPNGVVTRGTRLTALVGGLIGILLGLVVGPAAALPLRLLSRSVLKFLRNVWAGAAAGSVLGLGSGLLIHQYWHPSPEAFVYTITHSVVVGGAVGVVAVAAEPSWL